ncbi:MAG: glycine cleavage system protein GcvH [Chloroflexi bacterium]|nr:glycine cleavage system protein GcvH [Chloroflexota bacterium]MDE2702971.1 glycine cleavage system protein GcvH [Chloroflexota bacterium]MXX66503.1 glycine cleavage system protein GcvH [Chloroflexota bacterium]MYC47357.1 glycine cleavage system protein GcvH [Chloroflexota bacterium]
MNPQDRRYSREHEWARPETDSEFTVGISDYAQSELGDIVFVELPAVGTSFKQMESFGVVESVKAVSDLYAPLSGEVVAVNSELEMAPELVNDDPFGGGWMIRMRIDDPAELESLLDAAAYDALTNELRA